LDLKRDIRDRRHRLWWRLARLGSEDAFRRLYGELYAPVWAFTAARVRGEADAEDLVGLVFQRFVENLDGYDAGRGSLLTWLLGMARNAIIDHHRRLAAHGAARRQTVDVADLADVLAADGGDDPLASLIDAERIGRVRRWLQRQAPEVREMFALRYGDGLSVAETARVLGLGEAAVKQRFVRTTRRIRQELLTEENPNPESEGGPPCMIAD